MQLNPRALALTSGILWGLMILLVTWWALIFNLDGHTISKLKVFYIGYKMNFMGSIIGMVWGFVDGVICGYIFATVYNLLSKSTVKELPAESKE